MDFKLSNVADALMSQASMFNCSLEDAWEQWMHPILTERFTFEEVKKYIDEKVELGSKYKRMNDSE